MATARAHTSHTSARIDVHIDIDVYTDIDADVYIDIDIDIDKNTLYWT